MPTVSSHRISRLLKKIGRLSGFSRLHKGFQVVIGVTGVLIVSAGCIWLWQHYISDSNKAVTQGSICTGQTLHTVAPYLSGSNQTQFKAEVDKIQATKNFDKDANCLYVVTNYYLATGDALNARKYFDELKTSQAPSPTPVLGSISALEGRLKMIEKQSQETINGLRGVEPVNGSQQ